MTILAAPAPTLEEIEDSEAIRKAYAEVTETQIEAMDEELSRIFDGLSNAEKAAFMIAAGRFSGLSDAGETEEEVLPEGYQDTPDVRHRALDPNNPHEVVAVRGLPQNDVWEEVGYIGVDSGQIVCADPCNLPTIKVGNPVPPFDFGVVLNPGDGVYPVDVLSDDLGYIEARIRFRDYDSDDD